MSHKTLIADRSAIRGAIALQLKLTARLDTEMAAALTGKGQDELRKHFLDSAQLMLNAAKELDRG